MDGTSLNEEAPVSCVEERKRRARNPRTEEIMIRSKTTASARTRAKKKMRGSKSRVALLVEHEGSVGVHAVLAQLFGPQR